MLKILPARDVAGSMVSPAISSASTKSMPTKTMICLKLWRLTRHVKMF